MENQEEKLKNILNRNSNAKKTSKKSKSNRINRPKTRAKKIDTTPIDDSKLSIRELKNNDKYDLFKIVGDFRRDYYINVYKQTFRSWFTYSVTAVLLATSLTFINSKMSGICLPPLIVTVFLLWKVNRYRKMNRNLNGNDLELLNQNESIYCKFKSTEARRKNQGVLLAFLKENKSLEELDLDDIDLSDLDTDNSDPEERINEKNKRLVGYLVYGKQNDELETVCIKEICIDKDYRKRKIATHFIRRASTTIFKTLGYRRVTFVLSNFHTEAFKGCEKHSNLVNKLYSWTAYRFVPGVTDERSSHAFNISQLSY